VAGAATRMVPMTRGRCRPRPRRLRAAGGESGGGPNPGSEEEAKLKAEYEEKMKDPAVKAQMEGMQKMMQNPEIQKQMQEQMKQFESPEFKSKIEKLKDDPELKEMFEEMKTGGMGALMKFWNDPKMLQKFSEKMGASGPRPPTAGAQSPAQAEMPAADNLLDAAKYGDLEATEDYIAIGRDVNEGDGESRTPLHFASGAGHVEICKLLLEEGANVDATDSKQNTPLHYAAGYGRAEIVALLVESGSKVGLQNGNGKKASDLAKLNPDNPILKDEELLASLTPSSPFVDQ